MLNVERDWLHRRYAFIGHNDVLQIALNAPPDAGVCAIPGEHPANDGAYPSTAGYIGSLVLDRCSAQQCKQPMTIAVTSSGLGLVVTYECDHVATIVNELLPGGQPSD